MDYFKNMVARIPELVIEIEKKVFFVLGDWGVHNQHILINYYVFALFRQFIIKKTG